MVRPGGTSSSTSSARDAGQCRCTTGSRRSSGDFGSIERTEPWGRRKLAYGSARTKLRPRGLNGPGELIKELDRRLKVTDLVVRHLVVRVDEENRVADRRQTKRKDEAARRRVARGLPPPGAGAGEAARTATRRTANAATRRRARS
jgi:ribosomal protein S6